MRMLSSTLLCLVALGGCSSSETGAPQDAGSGQDAVADVALPDTLPPPADAGPPDGESPAADAAPDADPIACSPGVGGACPEPLVCDMQGCSLGGSGVCVAVPETCPETLAPVCSCEGVTYDNDCLRLKDGAALQGPGECEPPEGACAGPDGLACEDSGSVCDVPDCGDETWGYCTERPTECPADKALVCGCDGVTYGNDCLRLQAGAALFDYGACPRPCGGLGDLACEREEICDRHSCNPEALGVCVPQALPETCPDQEDPVCGCDGLTYANDCLRLAAGVALAGWGECLYACGPTLGQFCPTGKTCDLLSCHEDSIGLCVVVPPTCPDVWMPVCGCDGNTYANDCQRQKAGWARASEGECP